MVRLIVNADDYGRTPGVAAGIREAHRRGIVTSTTAMMNMPGIGEALHAAREECPRLGLGVHLLLTVGGPLLPAERVRSLIGGDALFLRPEALAGRLSALVYGEVLAEWRAQVERFVAVVGEAPDHLDAHHHVAYWAPVLLRAMLELARAYGCAVRMPTGPRRSTWPWTCRPAWSGHSVPGALRWWTSFARGMPIALTPRSTAPRPPGSGCWGCWATWDRAPQS